MPNFSSLAGLEVAGKFVVVGWVGWLDEMPNKAEAQPAWL